MAEYDADLLTQAIEAVRDETDQRDDPEFRYDDGRQEYRTAAMPKSLSLRVARQVLICAGLGPQGTGEKDGSLRVSLKERAAELLGLEDTELLFADDNSLSDIERYRDQMAEGDEPSGYDGEFVSDYEVWL
jgi:hypothetical protein